jgi:hypothetical protein
MRRFTFHILIALLTFGIGSFVAFKFVWQKERQTIVQNSQESRQEIDVQIQKPLPQRNENVFDKDDECKEWSDEVDYQPIIKKWLRGENLNNVPHCSKTGKEAKNSNPSNVTPTLIDLNGDGRNELALRSGCSPTGNCDMEIFERTGKGYRNVFRAVHGVHVFGLNKHSNKKYRNVWATMHGGWNDGDMVIYRYNGKNYKAIKCFEYLYEEFKDKNGETKAKDKPTLTPTKCWTE